MCIIVEKSWCLISMRLVWPRHTRPAPVARHLISFVVTASVLVCVLFRCPLPHPQQLVIRLSCKHTQKRSRNPIPSAALVVCRRHRTLNHARRFELQIWALLCVCKSSHQSRSPFRLVRRRDGSATLSESGYTIGCDAMRMV
jgi:hypothetical protein